MRVKILYIFLVIFFITVGCAVRKKTTKKPKAKNVSFLYNPSVSKINIEHKIFHNNDSLSSLFLKINSRDLLLKSEGNTKKAKILVKYRIFHDSEKFAFYDSLTTIYNIDFSKRKEIKIDIPLKLKKENYFILLKIKDLYNDRKSEYYFSTKKKTKYYADNFYAVNKKTKKIKYDNIVKSTDSLQVFYRDKSQKKMFVYYFSNRFKPSPPPFSISMVKARYLKPDSVFSYQVNDSSFLTFPKLGFYEILADSSQKNGITFFNFGDDFPYVKTPTQMLNPISYLTSQTEFKNYKSMPNKKIAVDEFWLKTSKSANSAKGLIRVFYNRVKFANIYFTSYKEGWKTDRGMVYIIYGAPSVIYKSNKIEKWIYSSQNSLMQFTFVNKFNVFTDNNFEVEHNEAYGILWYKAIDTWRNGRIFSISN